MSHYRVEVYTPIGRGDLVCAWQTWHLIDRQAATRWLEHGLPGEGRGASALLVHIGERGETVVERWRVAPDGRVLRQCCDPFDTEHEVQSAQTAPHRAMEERR